MKRIFTLTLVLLLTAALLALPVLAMEEGPTKAEIQQKWQEVHSASTAFDQTPSVCAPYASGSLTDDFLASGVTYLNYVRFVAGLPEITDDDTFNLDAQHGAVVLAAIDTLTHYPDQPDDMSDTFFNRGYSATTSSNISARWGFSEDTTMLQSAISGCMSDSSSQSNLSSLGHRRWLLNPRLGKVGFGYAVNPESGWHYIVTKVHDRSGANVDYDFISWPAAGNHPTNLFATTDPWSITLNPSKYQIPAASDLTITITRRSDGKQWSFDSKTGSPTTSENPYMLVERSGYGVSNCIIFHPGSLNVDAWEGVFDVSVKGLKTKSGAAATLRYSVDFFDVTDLPCEHSYQATVTEPTCTKGGYTTHTCTRCGHSYVDSHTDALDHDWTAWYYTLEPTCTEYGEERQDCTRCGSWSTRSVRPSGHSYHSVVTEATCTEPGFTTHTCTRCGDSYADSHTAAMGHGWSDWTVTKVPGCETAGTEGRSCSRCDAAEQRPIAPTGHSWDDGVVVTEPTEDTEGLRRHTCLACGATQDRAIPPLSHVHSYTATVVEPTCTEPGFTRHACDCGDSYANSYTDPLGHDWRGLECLRCGETRGNPFRDTDPLSFYFEPVLWAVENGVTTGATADTFNPLGQCQRAQVVTFLWRSVGCPQPESTVNPFTDVQKTDFFYTAVLWAVEEGITNGLSADKFGPLEPCNRAQVVTFLWRAMGSPKPSLSANPFADVLPGQFYHEPVLWAVEQGITNGISATEFGINAVCNRAQIVTFLYRTLA